MPPLMCFFLCAHILCCIGLYFCWFNLKWLAFFLLLWCLPIFVVVPSQLWHWEVWLKMKLPPCHIIGGECFPGVKVDLWLCKSSISGLHLYLPNGVFWPLPLCNWWSIFVRIYFLSPRTIRLRWFAYWLQWEVYSEVSLRDLFQVWGCFPPNYFTFRFSNEQFKYTFPKIFWPVHSITQIFPSSSVLFSSAFLSFVHQSPAALAQNPTVVMEKELSKRPEWIWWSQASTCTHNSCAAEKYKKK